MSEWSARWQLLLAPHSLQGRVLRNEATRAAATPDNPASRHLNPKESIPRISLFEPSNEANKDGGECGENVGEQLLLSQPPPRRLLLFCVPDRTGLALFDLPDAQPFELTAPGAPLSPSCHLASHLLGLRAAKAL